MSRKMMIASIVLAVILIIGHPSFASLSYLFEGARPMAMGGAFVAVADDANTIFFNPAGLGLLKNAEILTAYTQSFGDVNCYKIASYYSLSDYGTLAIGGDQVNVGPIPITSIDENGTPETISGDNYTRRVLLVSYSKNISDVFSIGISLKRYEEYFGIFSLSGSGTGSSIGILYRPAKWLSLGTNLEDYFKSKFIYGSGIEEEIPTSFASGFSIRPTEKLVLVGEVIKRNLKATEKNNLIYKAGTEIKFLDWFFFRLGYQKSNYEGYPSYEPPSPDIKTAGLGLILFNNLKMDYAYKQTHYAWEYKDRDSHYFSLGYRF